MVQDIFIQSLIYVVFLVGLTTATCEQVTPPHPPPPTTHPHCWTWHYRPLLSSGTPDFGVVCFSCDSVLKTGLILPSRVALPQQILKQVTKSLKLMLSCPVLFLSPTFGILLFQSPYSSGLLLLDLLCSNALKKTPPPPNPQIKHISSTPSLNRSSWTGFQACCSSWRRVVYKSNSLDLLHFLRCCGRS